MVGFRRVKFLTQVIVFALLVINGSVVSARRPKELRSDGWQTCTSEIDCPMSMWCWLNPVSLDSSYCECFNAFGFTRKLPTKDTPLYTLNPEDRCERQGWTTMMYLASIFMAFWWQFWFYSQLVFVIRCIRRAEAWTNNVATRTLILLVFSCVGVTAATLCYLFSPNDKSGVLFDGVRSYCIGWVSAWQNIMLYELVVAWIDLVQKTATLSRSTAPTLIAAKYFIRICVISYAIFVTYVFASGTWASFALLNLAIKIIYLIIINFSGRSLRRMLVPDPDDKSHANFPAAESIRQLYVCLTISIVNQTLVEISWLILMGSAAFLGTQMIIGAILWQGSMMIIFYIVLQYVKFGSRKSIRKFESEPTFLDNLVGNGNVLGKIAMFLGGRPASARTVRKASVV